MQIDPHIIHHFQNLISEIAENTDKTEITHYRNIFYQYRIVSLDHFPELQEHMDRLRQTGQLGDHPAFLHYMKSRTFLPPENFPDAKFVIVLAYFKPHAQVTLEYKGNSHSTMVPSPYHDDLDENELLELVRSQILPQSTSRVEVTQSIPVKTLATKSGLAKYGRNNICYVPHFGSSITIRTFLTDYGFTTGVTDPLGEMKMLPECESCKVCQKLCPNQCISPDHFVIDVNRCLTLHNEIVSEIPPWVSEKAHNALIGCLKCQLYCPVNREIRDLQNKLPTITEEEVQAILDGKPGEISNRALYDKLKFGTIDFDENVLETMQRNFRLILKL